MCLTEFTCALYKINMGRQLKLYGFVSFGHWIHIELRYYVASPRTFLISMFYSLIFCTVCLWLCLVGLHPVCNH